MRTPLLRKCAVDMDERKNRTVWWSLPARQDLEEIAAYLYKVAPQNSTEKLLRALIAAGDDLSERALFWPERRDVPGVRSVLVRPYSVFYQVPQNEVEIVRVLHGHRNLEAILRTISRGRV